MQPSRAHTHIKEHLHFPLQHEPSSTIPELVTSENNFWSVIQSQWQRGLQQSINGAITETCFSTIQFTKHKFEIYWCCEDNLLRCHILFLRGSPRQYSTIQNNTTQKRYNTYIHSHSNSPSSRLILIPVQPAYSTPWELMTASSPCTYINISIYTHAHVPVLYIHTHPMLHMHINNNNEKKKHSCSFKGIRGLS